MNKPSLPTLCLAIFVALFISGTQDSCKQKPTIATVDTPLLAPGGFFVELAAAAVPPGSAQCANGTVLISSVGNLFSLEISTGKAEEISSRLPTPTPESSPGELYYFGVDPQMVRLKDGSIVYLRQGWTTAPLKGSNPEWFSYNNGQRGYFFIWRTNDCGASWEVYHPIDAQDFLGGKCAWPQAVLDSNGVSQKWFGGFDLSQLYADPWNGNLYLTTSCRGGTEPQFSEHLYMQNLLFTLRPGDSDWHEPVVLPWDPPLVMTSTKSGRLWLYHCDENQPQPQGRLYISEDQGNSVVSNPGMTVVVDDTSPTHDFNQCLGVTSDKLAGNQTVNTQDYSLSRSGDDQVRLAYPRVENGRQVLQTVIITKFPDKITVKPVETFRAAEADASIVQHSFVESDRVDLKQESNVAALYWLESSPGTGRIKARYTLVRSNIDWSPPQTASAGSWIANHDGVGGDYINGAFYFENGEPHFVLVWPQSEPDITYANMNLHYAIVKSKL